MTDEKRWNVELPRGFHARLATADEITRGERFAIANAMAKAQSALIRLTRATLPRLEEMVTSRSADEVAVEFDLYWRATVPTAKEKADFVKRASGKSPYDQLSKEERDEAQATVELVTRHAKLSEGERAEAQNLVNGIANERASRAELAAREDLSPEEQDALFAHQAARVFAFLRDWDLTDRDGKPVPLPTSISECEQIPETTFDALFDACREENLPRLETESSARAIADPKAPTGD